MSKLLFQKLFSELNEYVSTVSPYVDVVLNCFIKLLIGEEYKLFSELIDSKEVTININKTEQHSIEKNNKYQHYMKNKQ